MEEYHILNKINSIEDFKKIDKKDYPALADELRSFLVSAVSEHGGHLASNLGAVELVIALHHVFSTPKDKIVFDVGHQSYVHKILTGRREAFKTLRTKGGLGGFPKRRESEHDSFDTGHSSTSISAALGMLRAKKLLGEEGSVVAVIGDGAMTGGMSFEALNDAGQSKLPLLVILNDNEMSISGNVGALSNYFSKVRTSKRYLLFKRNIENFLSSIPKIGRPLANWVYRLKNRIKYFLLPKNIWFEAMGFTYLGPIDGHDTEALIAVLKQASAFKWPALVHVVSKKGKGYMPAQLNPERFHGIGPFDKETGAEKSKKARSNSAVFGDALVRLAENDNRIAAITAAMSNGTGLSAFEHRFPERFFDVGIAEQHAVTMAAGMAAGGLRPVVAIYSTFMQRAYDQALHDVCLQSLPVLFALDRAGLVGEDGETHQGVYDMAYMLTMPNIAIAVPTTQCELEKMIELLLSIDMPAAIRYPRGALPIGDPHKQIEFGKWDVINPISDVVVIASGRVAENAKNACEGLNVGLVNALFIRPFDEAVMAEINKKARCVITVEDGIRTLGMGAYLSSHFKENIKLINLGVTEKIVEHATVAQQDEQCSISACQIRKVVEENL
ncbi:MAG: 1-deoxy-D-xylulose-5-phosphate synthase [Clostridia bacterium]|nr:1-deoxy-D-xylulose-5-phosphate synthase [Clostridia bacterium]